MMPEEKERFSEDQKNEEQLSEKEKTMLTAGQNRKTTVQPPPAKTEHETRTANTDATIGANPNPDAKESDRDRDVES
jgi:hypothetical protein